MKECINFEIKIKGKLRNFITLYRSLNQCQDDLEPFISNLELNLDSVIENNPLLTVVLGDFNGKLSLWYNDGITTYEDSTIDGVISQFGLQQIIKKPTHICIDQIFTTRPNLVTKSVVPSSQHANCSHHITIAKLLTKVSFLGTIVFQISTQMSKCNYLLKPFKI